MDRRADAAFLHAIGEHHLYAAYHLIALRGLRRGEAAGLRWVDVDLEHGTAVICQQLQRRYGRLQACPPKTAHSAGPHHHRRPAGAPRPAACRGRRPRGPLSRDNGYVFTNLNGDPVSLGRLTHLFQKMLAQHRLHDLRHGAATLALAAGVELKVVQEMLGRSSIGLTADTYTSVLPKVAHTAAAETTATHVLRAGWRVPGTKRRRRPAVLKRPTAARADSRSAAALAA
ncbi:tyrosine-type recombinase/integrase [Actinomadura rugatobispora]|uniref:Tyrosine-type recombinase/integrase n=1 Tax=Actinomadura rugatobispora TaxID=1994 RepID=A0ABW0ZN75_9ACTN|nr:hypothetical protein GCM10010200_035440 [Actinomadura rugatobispora]